jgi:hypothetical protein
MEGEDAKCVETHVPDESVVESDSALRTGGRSLASCFRVRSRAR